MAQDKIGHCVPSGSGSLHKAGGISRKAFLVETLAIATGASALLAEVGTAAEGKAGEEIPLARYIQSEFNEEADVAAKYAAFAVQAKIEGYPQTARLLQALAAAENIHSELLLRLENCVKSTADNLQAGADYESYLAAKVLPLAAAQAKREKNGKAERVFNNFLKAGGRHEKILRLAREQILAGHDTASQPLWVCPTCGTVLAGAAPDNCPVCSTPSSKFRSIA